MIACELLNANIALYRPIWIFQKTKLGPVPEGVSQNSDRQPFKKCGK